MIRNEDGAPLCTDCDQPTGQTDGRGRAMCFACQDAYGLRGTPCYPAITNRDTGDEDDQGEWYPEGDQRDYRQRVIDSRWMA